MLQQLTPIHLVGHVIAGSDSTCIFVQNLMMILFNNKVICIDAVNYVLMLPYITIGTTGAHRTWYNYKSLHCIQMLPLNFN